MNILTQTFEVILMTFLSSLVLIIMGLTYFMITLWTVKTGSNILGVNADANWTVFSASIIAGASMLGSSLSKR